MECGGEDFDAEVEEETELVEVSRGAREGEVWESGDERGYDASTGGWIGDVRRSDRLLVLLEEAVVEEVEVDDEDDGEEEEEEEKEEEEGRDEEGDDEEENEDEGAVVRDEDAERGACDDMGKLRRDDNEEEGMAASECDVASCFTGAGDEDDVGVGGITVGRVDVDVDVDLDVEVRFFASDGDAVAVEGGGEERGGGEQRGAGDDGGVI